MSVNEKKEFKNISKQVDYLVETKNIIYSEKIATTLSERAYTSIINPYKRVFAKGKDDNGHVYDGFINFDNYIELAALDDYFSFSFYKWIGIFEKKFKVVLAYVVSNHLSTNGDLEGTSYVKHLNKYFYTKDPIYLDNVGLIPLDVMYSKKGVKSAYHELIITREEFLRDKVLKIGTSEILSKNNLVKYYQQNHHKVPFWLLVHDQTLGELQILNALLRKDLKEQVYRSFHPTKEKIASHDMIKFSGQIELLRKIRNIVSHNESIIGFLQNIHTNEVDQFFTLIKLLKTNNDDSIVSKSNLANLESFKQNEFNKNTLITIMRLFKELQ